MVGDTLLNSKAKEALSMRPHKIKLKGRVMKMPLWLVAFAYLGCILACFCPKEHRGWVLFVMGVSVVLATIFFITTYVYWTFKEPDYLGVEVVLEKPEVPEGEEKT